MATAGLADQSVSFLLLPTDDSGPRPELDKGIAIAISTMIQKLLNGNATFRKGSDKLQELKTEHIAIVATHWSSNTRIQTVPPNKLRLLIRVVTTERWRGLEHQLLSAVHKPSNTISPV